MINLLNAIFSIAKIKQYIKIAFIVVAKSQNVLEFLERELAGTELGEKLKDVLPKLSNALSAVEQTLGKILKIFGEYVIDAQGVRVRNSLTLAYPTINEELEELNRAVEELKKLK